MRVLPQSLESIFEVQMKRVNEKMTRKKIGFPTYKTRFFFFPSLWTPHTFKPHNFLISYSFSTI